MSFVVKLGYGNVSLPKCSQFFVKFTDSSLKSLEEFQTKGTKADLKMQFDGSEGFLQIPLGHSFANDLLKSYAFTFTPEGKDGLTECFGSLNSGSPFKRLGDFSHKLIIKASDDVFQNTLEKMSMVEFESKKNCVKEIVFKDHDKKLANFKSKHSSAAVEPKKASCSQTLVAPKSKKHETVFKPIQSSLTGDSLDFTARINTRVAPLMKRPIPESLQHLSPTASSLDVPSQMSTDPEMVSQDVHVITKKPRVAHKKDFIETRNISLAEATYEKDFLSMYPPICTSEEEEAYRTEFERDYPIYKDLHFNNERRVMKFKQYVEELKHESFKSDVYQKIISKIYNEYATLLKNAQHMEERVKCLDLRKKLFVIKRRISDFNCRVGI